MIINYKYTKPVLVCLLLGLVLIITKVLWLPVYLRYSIYLNPVISWRLYDCNVKSVEYDLEGFKGYNTIAGLLFGNVKEMVYHCENKISSKFGITYNFKFAVDGCGKLKETCFQGHVPLNTRIYKIIEKAESCDAVTEIVKKNDITSAQLGLLTLNQEIHQNAIKYGDKIIWDIDKKQLFITDLPWKNYKYLPGHLNSLTVLKDTSIVLSTNDTILSAVCYPCDRMYRYKLKIAECKEGYLEINCDDGIVKNRNWLQKIDTLDVSYLNHEILTMLESYGLRKVYLERKFKLVQAKAIKRLDYKFVDDHYVENSTLWGRGVFKWETGIRCIDDFNNDGFLICIYFTYQPNKDSFEMIRVGTSAWNFYSQIKLRELDRLKNIYSNNYSLRIKSIPKKDTYIKLLPDGNLAIKWGSVVRGGELNLDNGKIYTIPPGAMFDLIPGDIARYNSIDNKFPLTK